MNIENNGVKAAVGLGIGVGVVLTGMLAHKGFKKIKEERAKSADYKAGREQAEAYLAMSVNGMNHSQSVAYAEMVLIAGGKLKKTKAEVQVLWTRVTVR